MTTHHDHPHKENIWSQLDKDETLIYFKKALDFQRPRILICASDISRSGSPYSETMPFVDRSIKNAKLNGRGKLQSSSQILKHLCDFPLPMLIWVCSHFSAPKYARVNIGKGEAAHLSENKGAKSDCKKFGKNSRQMAPVSTICDEYCI